MDLNETRFEAGWYSQDLKGYRDEGRHSTYHLYIYESVPPLSNDLFRGDFVWLRDAPTVNSHLYSDLEYLPKRMSVLSHQAAALGVSLPPDFTSFLSSGWLPSKVRSCTDCYFDLPTIIQPCAADLGGHVISFLRDSQGVLYWGLYLSPSGGSCVVNTPYWYDIDAPVDDWEEDDDMHERAIPAPSVKDLMYCSPSFESFAYRFWIENEIWFAIYDGEPLTDRDLAYLSHYRSPVVE